jgi:hypothetical protein
VIWAGWSYLRHSLLAESWQSVDLEALANWPAWEISLAPPRF